MVNVAARHHHRTVGVNHGECPAVLRFDVTAAHHFDEDRIHERSGGAGLSRPLHCTAKKPERCTMAALMHHCFAMVLYPKRR